MFRYLRVFLVTVVLPGLAVGAALFSLSAVATALIPERATQVPVLNANAYAANAVARLAGLGQPEGADATRSLARAGRATFLVEPTNSNAVSLMAMARQLRGDVQGARRLYQDALRIDKRNRIANLWLIEDASANGRVGYILDRYDVLLRTGGPTSAALYDTLATALKEPAIIPHLEARLARNPPWAEQFWLRVTPNPSAIANVGVLRTRLHDRKVINPASNDDDIVRRLVGVEEFDIAADLAHRLAGAPVGEGMTLRNGGFTHKPRVPPFDWETFSSADYGAELDPSARTLTYYSVTAVDNLVARQLLEAKPGRYVLSYRMRNPEVLATLHSTIRVGCASPGFAVTEVAMKAATGQVAFTVPASCRYLWVELWAQREATPSDYPEDGQLESITVRAAS